MNSRILEIYDYYELLALHRALLESKFCSEPNDMDVSGSPIIAKLHRNVVDLLIAAEIDRYGITARDNWDKWLRLDSERREWQVALSRARSHSRLELMNESDRRQHIINLLSPFHVSEDQVNQFITQI